MNDLEKEVVREKKYEENRRKTDPQATGADYLSGRIGRNREKCYRL